MTTKLVPLLTRVRQVTADQLLLAAAEDGISPYAKHQHLLDEWAARRIGLGSPTLKDARASSAGRRDPPSAT